jgi:hypothetical protein
MPRGSKSKYTSKQKRQAHHIEDSARRRGASAKRAAEIGYATVNKQDHGGKKSGSGRGKTSSRASSPSSSRSSSRSSGRAGQGGRGGSKAAHARAGRASHRS